MSDRKSDSALNFKLFVYIDIYKKNKKTSLEEVRRILQHLVRLHDLVCLQNLVNFATFQSHKINMNSNFAFLKPYNFKQKTSYEQLEMREIFAILQIFLVKG